VKYRYQRKSVKIFAGYGEQIRQKTLFFVGKRDGKVWSNIFIGNAYD